MNSELKEHKEGEEVGRGEMGKVRKVEDGEGKVAKSVEC